MYWWHYYKHAVIHVFCYADDPMLASLTVTGPQTMINVVTSKITEHGLQFNPKKTERVIFGRSTLQLPSAWELNGTKLTETDSVTYLGVTLSYIREGALYWAWFYIEPPPKWVIRVGYTHTTALD